MLGYLSLRQWGASAELLFREQARDMATMAAEKVEMAVLKSEEECVSGLLALVLEPGFRPEQIPAMVSAWKAKTALFDRVYLFDRQGSLLYPRELTGADAPVFAALLGEISQGFWERGGRRHFAVGDQVVLAAVIPGAARGPVLVALGRNEDVLRRDVLDKTFRALEGKSMLAIVDKSGQPVYASGPLEGAERVLTVALGEALPAWRVALYQPAGAAPQDAMRRQRMIFLAAFALLLVVIVLGLGATYRVVRRESEMARLKSDFVANVSHDLKTPLSLIRMFAETLEMNRVPDEASRREYYGGDHARERAAHPPHRQRPRLLPDRGRAPAVRHRSGRASSPSSTRWWRRSATPWPSRGSRSTWRSRPTCPMCPSMRRR